MRSQINASAYSKTISLINCLKAKHCMRGRTDPWPIWWRLFFWLNCEVTMWPLASHFRLDPIKDSGTLSLT